MRFDDICPTMNWRIWADIEEMLVTNDIKPILAVVPDNRDSNLMVEAPVPDFWDRVRNWQACGWSIALHGYQHVYVNKNRGILSLSTAQSEFAGVSREEQREKIRCGLEIFARQGVRADCWVAPSHSFDWTTVELLVEIGVKVISDGLWPWPHTDKRGITWVPQQLWSCLRPMRSGVWTVCIHHNGWGDSELERFRLDLSRCASSLINLQEAATIGRQRQLSLMDRFHAWSNLALNQFARPVLGRLLRRGHHR